MKWQRSLRISFGSVFGFAGSDAFGLRWLVVAAMNARISVFATIKEFWYDEAHENPLVRGSSPLDFGMYMAGVATAVGLWFV